MDVARHIQNLGATFGRVRGPRDALHDLLVGYSHRLPRWLRADRYDVRFRFPMPIGAVQLSLRTNAGADAFIFSEVFCHRYYAIPLHRRPATILDLGANAGLTAVYFARCFPEAAIACVEPMPDNAEQLRRNLALNDVDAVVFEAAVDARDGVVPMSTRAKSYAHQVLSSQAEEHELVQALCIDTIMRRLGWDRIGLLKIDIEGHETVILNGACRWADAVDAIVIEIHDEDFEAELRRFAGLYGFSVRQQAGLFLLERATAANGEAEVESTTR